MNNLKHTVRVIITLSLAIIIGGVIVELSGKDAIYAYTILFTTAFGSKLALANTLLAATPLIFTGLAAVVAFRAGVFNVGVEGSLFIGAFAAAWVGFTLIELPAVAIIPLSFVAGGLAGGLWGA